MSEKALQFTTSTDFTGGDLSGTTGSADAFLAFGQRRNAENTWHTPPYERGHALD